MPRPHKRTRRDEPLPDDDRQGIARTPSTNLIDPSSDPTSATPPPPKRRRSDGQRKAILTLEGALSEELLVRVLSFLPVEDLVQSSLLSSAWHRLSQEPQLWRALYLSTYASNRPSPPPSPHARTRPWRELYKISTNWRRGSAKPSVLRKTVRQAVLPEAPKEFIQAITPEADPEVERSPPRPAVPRPRSAPTDTLVQFHHHFFLTATRTLPLDHSVTPVSVFQTASSGGPAMLLGQVVSTRLAISPTSNGLGITEMRLDDKPSRRDAAGLQLAIFYSNGQFALFHLSLPTTTNSFSSTELYTAPIRRFAPIDPVVLARFYSPFLVTCSSSFTMRFWRVFLPSKTGAAMELHEVHAPLQSHESWWPVVLTLAPTPSVPAPPTSSTVDLDSPMWPAPLLSRPVGSKDNPSFTATLAYASPVFPSSWSIGVQQFHLSPLGTLTSHQTVSPPLGLASRGVVTALEHSGRFVVASRADNTLDLYELVEGGRKLQHCRTMWGHTARVCAVAVEGDEDGIGGRCVSGGADGSIKVWEFGGRGEAVTVDGREEVERERESEEMVVRRPQEVRKVFFDEAKIVSIMEGEGGQDDEYVRLLRFD